MAMARVAPAILAGCMLAAVPSGWAQAPRSDADAERALVQYRAGWNHMRSEQFEEALEAFDAALSLNPRLNLANYGKGRAFMALHRYSEAVVSYETCRDTYLADAGRKYSSEIEATRVQQDRLMELQFLQRELGTGPQNARTQDQQRQVTDAVRRTENAVERGTQLSIEASVPAFVWVALGSAYFRADHMNDAEKAYKEAVQADPRAGEAHNNLAVIYLLTNRPREAEAEVKVADKSGFRVNPELKEQIRVANKK
jgi:tetratricopeptide (TPR) repeat protein